LASGVADQVSSTVPLLYMFVFTAAVPSELSTLSLHDALPISDVGGVRLNLRDEDMVMSAYDEMLRTVRARRPQARLEGAAVQPIDRKSTRLNSSHVKISYAVFCLKKKQQTIRATEEEPSRSSR